MIVEYKGRVEGIGWEEVKVESADRDIIAFLLPPSCRILRYTEVYPRSIFCSI